MYAVPNSSTTPLVNSFKNIIADGQESIQYSSIDSEAVPYAIILNAAVTRCSAWSGALHAVGVCPSASDFREKNGRPDIES